MTKATRQAFTYTPQQHSDLLVEACPRLIAEDDKYVVIAIRVEKSAVRNAMPFLAALSEV